MKAPNLMPLLVCVLLIIGEHMSLWWLVVAGLAFALSSVKINF